MHLVYEYDGSLEGFLCCVYRSFTKREMPGYIRCIQQGQLLLEEESVLIETDITKAVNVFVSFDKISPDARDFVQNVFLTCLDGKELLLLQWIYKGYREKVRIIDLLTDKVVFPLQKAVLALNREAEHYRGFIRFSIFRNALISVITPKNNVLPLLGGHFSDRYPDELFLIYDKTNHIVLVHEPGQRYYLTHADNYKLPEMDADQKNYEKLWRSFCEHITIRERKNLKCQMNHLPLRFRADMTEFSPS